MFLNASRIQEKRKKMDQKTLFKISISVSLIGIFILLLLAGILKPRMIPISEINNKLLNQKVAIQGTIFRTEVKDTFMILSVEDSAGKIDVLCDCSPEKIQNNKKVYVEGTISEYKEFLQISADKIITMN